MFPDTWIWIVAITAIVFGTWTVVSVTKMVVSYLQGRSAGPSLTTNELAAMIGEAVEEAVRPLEDKIERLEQRQVRLLEGPPDEPTHVRAGSEWEEK